MNMWLNPVRMALDAARAPIGFFFRDDDAGWYDARLDALLDIFEEFCMPLDLAVIPQALTAKLAAKLVHRAGALPLGLHQHGFAHVNHELTGRKCEFGQSRAEEQQYQDIKQGKSLMQERLGTSCEPIFTPPWNRCTSATVKALRALDFALLSRDHSAVQLDHKGLHELSVSVDWCRYSADRAELGRHIAAAINQYQPVGIMLHHAVMAEDDLSALRELLELLKHNQARCHLMGAIATNNTLETETTCTR